MTFAILLLIFVAVVYGVFSFISYFDLSSREWHVLLASLSISMMIFLFLITAMLIHLIDFAVEKLSLIR